MIGVLSSKVVGEWGVQEILVSIWGIHENMTIAWEGIRYVKLVSYQNPPTTLPPTPTSGNKS